MFVKAVSHVLQGCTAWPEDFARRYRQQGYWLDITLNEMLRRSAAEVPDRVALVGGGWRVTYAQLVATIDNMAGHLINCGLKPYDRVVFQLPNSVGFVIAFFALLRIGVIPVFALPRHRREEIFHIVAHTNAVGYVFPEQWHDYDYRMLATEIVTNYPAVRHVLVLNTPAENQISLNDILGHHSERCSDLAKCALAPDDVALMLLSGGTTGTPKVIPRTHNDYVYNCMQSGIIAGFDTSTVFLALLPMAHNFTLGCPGVLGVLAHGGTAVIAPHTTFDTASRLIEEEGVTVVSASVPLIVNWLNAPPTRRDLTSLRVVMNGGAKLAPELRRRVEQTFGCIFQESFGTGEGLLNMTRLDDPKEVRFMSSGRPISPADEIRIVDESDQDVPDGIIGELIVRGPYTIRGYYNAPEKNRTAFTADGFYRMGDLVRRVGGQLFVEGRRADVINRGGEKISCDEVENYILGHPKIRNVCVVAMPDPVYGEKACAFVTLKGGETINLEEIKSYLLGRNIAKFKLPERLVVVSQFPLSPAGKVLRRELRKLAALETVALS